MIVLAMMTLFALLGVVFVTETSQDQTAALLNARSVRDGTDRTNDIQTALRALLDGGPTGASVIRGHSLLEDMFGNDSQRAIVRGVQGQPGLVSLALEGDPNENILIPAVNNQSLSQVPDYYTGRLCYVIDGAGRAQSHRIVASAPLGNNQVRVDLAWPDGANLVAAEDTVVLVGREYNGLVDPAENLNNNTVADLYEPNYLLNGLDPRRIGLAGPDEGFDAPGYHNLFLAYVTPDGQVLHPSFHPIDAELPQGQAGQPVGPGRGLGRRRLPPNDAHRNGLDTLNQPQFAPHILRPHTMLNWVDANNNGQMDAGEFFPNLRDTNGDGTADVSFLRDTNGDGTPDLLEADGIPNWDVDNDGDGRTDSVWTDIGLPVRYDDQGRALKPLVAFLVVDLDGRLNVNAHGQLNADLDGDGVFETHVSNTSQVGMADFPAGIGWSVSEVNLSRVFPQAAAAEYQRLLQGRPGLPAFDPNQPNLPVAIPGRWGEVNLLTDADGDGFPDQTYAAGHPFYAGLPMFPRPGRSDQDDDVPPEVYTFDQTNAPQGDLFEGTIAGSAVPDARYFGPPDFDGDTNVQGVSDEGFGRLVIQPAGLHGYAEASENHDEADEMYQEHLASLDQPFSDADLEALLRLHDIGGLQLARQSRLLQLAPDALVNDPQAMARRRVLTTSSWDLPTYNLPPAMPVSQTGQPVPPPNATPGWGNGVIGLYFLDSTNSVVERPDLFALLSPQTRAALRMDLNQAFGTNPASPDDPANQAGGLSNRQTMAQQLYALLWMLVDPPYSPVSDRANWNPPPPYTPDTRGRSTYLAQLAINIVDFRDPDNIMTGFEYDWDLSNGWDQAIEGDLGTTAGAERDVVWGLERPQVVINETLAYFYTDSAPDPKLWVELYAPVDRDHPGYDQANHIRFENEAWRLVLDDQSTGPLAAGDSGGLPGDDYNDPAAVNALDILVLDVQQPQAAVNMNAFFCNPAQPYDQYQQAGANGVNEQEIAGGIPDDGLPNDHYFVVGYDSDVFPVGAGAGPPWGDPVRADGTSAMQLFANRQGMVDPVPPGSAWAPTAVPNTPFAVYLQRLANPTLPWDRFTNPYVTVDAVDGEMLGIELNDTDNSNQLFSIERRHPYLGRDLAKGVQQNDQTDHSLGRINSVADTRYNWFTLNDRPFASPAELLLVAGVGPRRLTYDYENDDAHDPYTDAELLGRHEHLTNFFGTVGQNQNPDAPGLYRLLEFVEVPSRMNGTHDFLTFNATGRADGYRGRRFRVPGRVNLNTIGDLQVFQALMNAGGGGSWDAYVAGLWNRLQAARLGPDQILGTIDDEPIHSFAEAEVALTLLRPEPLGGNQTQGLFEATISSDVSGAPAGEINDFDSDAPAAYFRFLAYDKLANLSTTRSHVFAVWVTVGYFEVLDEDPGRAAMGLPAVVLGPEVGSDVGRVRRHRAFAIIDRSLAPGYHPDGGVDVGEAIRYLRVIE